MAAPEDPLTALDVIPLVVSGLALALSGFVAWRTDRRATKAEQKALDIATNSLWSDAIEATIRVISDPTREDAADRFQTLGVRLTALADALPHWEGLDTWFSGEMLLGAGLRRQVNETLSGNPTEEQGMKVLGIYGDWGQALSNNLRHLRNIGFNEKAIEGLARHSTEAGRSLREGHGWPEPGSDSSLRPLEGN